MRVIVGNGTRVRVSGGSGVSQRGTFAEVGSVEGAWVVKGNWDASTNLFPSSSVLKGYQYKASSNSTTLLMPDGGIIPAGTLIVAMVDDPGQTVANWYFLLSVI